MHPWEAKKLKAGDRVLWTSPAGTVHGTVVKKRYNSVWIQWDGGASTQYTAAHMDKIHTQARLDADATQRRLAEEIMEHNRKNPPPVRW